MTGNRTLFAAKQKILKGEDFLEDIEENLLNSLKSAKCGYIKIKKVSDNSGYLSKNEVRSGYTLFFGTGIGCYIFLDDNCSSFFEHWYSTSVVTDIDYENSTFDTYNSKYHFEFEEKEFNDIIKQMKDPALEKFLIDCNE